MSVDHLALWQELGVDTDEKDQHDFDYGLKLSCFLRPLRFWSYPLALGLRVVTEDQ